MENMNELWEVSKASLVCQKLLPEEFRVCSKPRLNSPAQAELEIGVEEIGKV